MHRPEDLNQLFQRFLNNSSNKEDLKELFHQFGTSNEEDLRLLIMKEMEREDLSEVVADENNPYQPKMQDLYQKISQKISTTENSPRVARINKSAVFGIAAALALFILFAAYLFKNKSAQPAGNQPTLLSDITPGSNRAVLTLANGKKIVLDDARKGQLLNASGITVTKTSEGQIVYTCKNKRAGSEDSPTFNTITTPPGGQFQVILPDKTKVWLNASSEIRFPTAFDPNERRVEMTGEAYFEVAKIKSLSPRVDGQLKRVPFIVKTQEQTVEVLGTHFNINAYHDENEIRTTLLEGSVRVLQGGSPRILKPGQQSVNNLSKQSLYVHNVETDEVVAWKNGLFTFNDTDIETIMRQVSRWYNVEVEYQGNVKGKQFAGSISRYDNVSQLLEMLESTGDIHFKIEGRRITVMP